MVVISCTPSRRPAHISSGVSFTGSLPGFRWVQRVVHTIHNAYEDDDNYQFPDDKSPNSVAGDLCRTMSARTCSFNAPGLFHTLEAS